MEDNIDIKTAIARVINHLENFYNGDNWVTSNLSEKVFSLPASEVSKRIPGYVYTIAQQVAHIVAWRNFGVEKLNGNGDFDITDNSADDWPEPGDWVALQKKFVDCHRDLIKAINCFPIDKWYTTVPGRKYSFLFLIEGIVEHDYYHYGQIGTILGAIRRMKE
jgi:DinB superfamily